MTLERKIIIALSAFILMSGIILGRFAYEQNKALHAASAVSAADAVQQKAEQQRIHDRDQADATQRQQAATAAEQVKTSAEAVRVITKYVPAPAGAPPSTVEVEKYDLTPAEQAKVPDAPSYVLQTQDAAAQTAKNLIACESEQKSLIACKADLGDTQSELILQKKTSTMWEATAKGGTKAHRLLKLLECAGLAGAGGAAGAVSHQPKWAAVGAVVGVTACQIF